jgi:ankyrin repeat protein/uncharacterized protein YceK
MRRIKFTLVLSLVGISACGTFISRTREDVPLLDTVVYGGTSLDAAMILAGIAAGFSGNEASIGVLVVPFALVDLPLSLLADTLLLPVSFLELRKRPFLLEIRESISLGDLDRLKMALASHPELLDRKARDGNSPIQVATNGSRAEIVQYLVSEGADLYQRDRQGRGLLQLAATNEDGALVGFLVDAGARVNAADGSGRTPLFEAAERGSGDVAALLLTRAADPNARDERGYTPLHVAAQKGQLQTAGILVDGGAQLEAKSNPGPSLREMLVIAVVFPPALLLLPFNRGEGMTPICIAALNDQIELIQLLRDRGADVGAPCPTSIARP